MKLSTLSHKIRLVPNKEQEQYFIRACGVARFVWNWGLSEWQRQYETGEKPTSFTLGVKFNSLRKNDFPWTYEVTKCASVRPFLDLGKAFQRFFKHQTRYPKFKKKGVHDSFYISNDKFRINGKLIRIPKLGWVKMREDLRFQGKIMSATVSRQADKWFVSIQVQLDQLPKQCESQAKVGIDLGVKTLATMYDGQNFHEVEGPKPLKKQLKKLQRLSKQLSRKKLGSKNRAKARQRLARQHYKIACIREDALHKLTHQITQEYKDIVIEDLNVSGMVKNRKLARAISDMGFHEFKRQLAYKSGLYGNDLHQVDRWFPSTKTCSRCGGVKDSMKLRERTYICEHCDFEIDRDHNAAINLFNTVGSTEIKACGEVSSGFPVWESETNLHEAGIRLSSEKKAFRPEVI